MKTRRPMNDSLLPAGFVLPCESVPIGEQVGGNSAFLPLSFSVFGIV